MLLTIGICVLLLILATAAYGGRSAAIWVPMARKDAERAMLLAGITRGDKVYDLGCGDGRVLVAAAQHGAHAIGYEVSLIPYLIACVRAWRLRKDPLGTMRVSYGNFWTKDLSDADVVYLYLMPDSYDRIVQKLRAECDPGTRIITYVWSLPDWQPITVSEREGYPKIWKYVV